jgi:hypothetical protein
MREARRADIKWTGREVESHERLQRRTLQLQKDIPSFVKEIIERHLKLEPSTWLARTSLRINTVSGS